MRFWFALAGMLLSLTAADAQTSERPRVQKGPSLHELPELTQEQKAKCLKEAGIEARIKDRVENFRECDDGGCYFDVPREPALELTQQQESGCRRKLWLQRRLHETREKLLEEQRENQKSN